MFARLGCSLACYFCFLSVLVLQAAFNKLRESIKTNFNDRFAEMNRRWGGGIMGAKTVHKVAMYEKQKAREAAARQGEA